jgi:hypothetical protein
VTRRATAGTLAVVLVALASLSLALRIAPYQIDDAFIVYRYAARLVHGQGFRFNESGPPVEGFSSPLWLLLLAGSARAIGPERLPAAGLVLGLAALGATIALAAAAARGQGAWPSLVAAALIALLPTSTLYAVAGLETLGFVALVVGFAGALAGALPRWVGVVCALLAPWMRPEGVFLFCAGAAQLLAMPGQARRAPWLVFAAALALGASRRPLGMKSPPSHSAANTQAQPAAR